MTETLNKLERLLDLKNNKLSRKFLLLILKKLTEIQIFKTTLNSILLKAKTHNSNKYKFFYHG